MISSRDEIMHKFASLSDQDNEEHDDLPFAEPDDVEEIPFADPEDVIEYPPEPLPEPGPPKQYTAPGSPAWVANKYPHAYLTASLPYRGYIHGKERAAITKRMLEYMVSNNPEMYFDLDIGPGHKLNEIDDLGKFKYAAARSLIEQDPEGALVRGLSYMRGFEDLFPMLWNNLVERDTRFPGMLHYRMLHLMKRIFETNEQFYLDNIVNTPIERHLMGRPDEAHLGRGGAKWLANKYPRTYLKGVRKMGEASQHVLDAQDNKATADAMTRIIATDPIKYFEWGLNRQEYLQKYAMYAASALIEKDPEAALLLRLYRKPEFAPLLPKLWNKLKELGESRRESGQEPFPGIVLNQVKSLMAYSNKMKYITPKE